MWIPYTDSVVVVTNDPEDQVKEIPKLKKISEDERFAPLRDLMLELSNEWPEPYTKESLQSIGFGELRDALLAIDPLGIKHVKRCNEAEAEFWKRSEGYQVRPSDELLQFDCGGQVCFHLEMLV
jgi:L-galactono-1,4-lactone dehydrogenase